MKSHYKSKNIYDHWDPKLVKKAAFNTENKVKTSKLKLTYRYVHHFFEQTTFHGCPQLAVKGRHCIEYFLWICALLTSMGLTVYICGISWHRFRHDATVIVLEKNVADWNITFPTTTMCPTTKVNKTILKELAHQYKVKDIEAFVNFFVSLSVTSFETYDKLPEYYEIPPENFLEIIIKAVYRLDTELSSTLTKETEEMSPILTDFGICYTHNSKIAPYFKPSYLIGMSKLEDLHELFYFNALEGDSFMTFALYNVPINVSIAGPYELPTLGTSFEDIDPQLFYDFDTACLPIVSSDEVRDLDVEQRNCRTRGDGSLRVSQVYSYNVCLMECRMNLAWELCKCIPYIYVNDAAPIKKENLPICDVKGMKCLAKNGTYLADLMEPVTKMKAPCKCYPLCTDFHFRILSTESSIGANGTKIQMKTFPKTRYKRTLIFGIADLIVNLGATAGFFLGCSALSFAEFIYFFTIRLLFIMFKKEKDESLSEAILRRERNIRKPRTVEFYH